MNEVGLSVGQVQLGQASVTTTTQRHYFGRKKIARDAIDPREGQRDGQGEPDDEGAA